MIVGLLLMLLGYFSEAVIPGKTVWNDEQAAAYQKASGELHGASYGKGHDHSKEHAHNEPDRSSPEYLKAKEAFDRAKSELDRAANRQIWIKYGIILTGVVISACGIVRVALDKMQADEEATMTHRPKKRSS